MGTEGTRLMTAGLFVLAGALFTIDGMQVHAFAAKMGSPSLLSTMVKSQPSLWRYQRCSTDYRVSVAWYQGADSPCLALCGVRLSVVWVAIIEIVGPHSHVPHQSSKTGSNIDRNNTCMWQQVGRDAAVDRLWRPFATPPVYVPPYMLWQVELGTVCTLNVNEFMGDPFSLHGTCCTALYSVNVGM